MQRALVLRSNASLHAITCPTLTRTIRHSHHTPRYPGAVFGASPYQRAPCTLRHFSVSVTSRRDVPIRRGAVRPSSQSRRRPAPRPQSKDEELEEIVKTLDLPTTEDIAYFSEDVLKNPCNVLRRPVSGLVGFREERRRTSMGYSHSIWADDPTFGQVMAVGQASTRETAEDAAYLKLLAEAYKNGNAELLFPISGATLKKEQDAVLDVYLFAARYQQIPEIVYNKIKRRGVLGYEVEISLPALGITAHGRAKSASFGAVAAALQAKTAIQKYMATEASLEGKVEEDEVFGISSGNAFWKWYAQNNKSISIDIQLSDSNGSSHARTVITRASGEDAESYDKVSHPMRKTAEDLARLVAAIAFTRDKTHLREDFFQEYKRNNYQVLPPVYNVTLDITRETEDAIHDAIRASHDAVQQLPEDYEGIEDERRRRTIYSPLQPETYTRKCEELNRRRTAYESRDDLITLRKTRSEFPMNQYAEDVLKTVKSNVYSIVIGATGSGKTTQVPQILLNDAVQQGKGASCNIICTQPRRIAAKSVAQRVADERAEFLGDCVGYHVKGDTKLPNYGGSINFCTTGILSQQLQYHADDIMDNVSHLIIDEVHERDTLIDFLLTNLKKLIKDRLAAGKKVPHVTLMSATIDPDLFEDYLKIETPTGEILKCPSLMVPGRTFPVREAYLDEIMRQLTKAGSHALQDSDTSKFIAAEQAFATSNKGIKELDIEESGSHKINWAAERQRATAKSPDAAVEQEQAMVPHALIAATIGHIANRTNQGAILAFLPGLEDIVKVDDFLRKRLDTGVDFSDTSKYKIFMLHSSIQDAQKEVFNPLPEGCRKIILATNIAETSITIPDVQHVVDTGKLRELQYDQVRRITKLSCVWASKSNTKQRAGRAGRVQDGNYYALFTKERYNSLRAVGLPELLRSDLSEVCLKVKNQGYSMPIKDFLAEAIEPPSMPSVDQAIQNLTGLQALNQDETLTALGKLLAQLPVHPSLGKMIVLGMIFRCLDPMLIIGASFASRDLFVRPLQQRAEAKEKKESFARNTLSDHIGLLAAVKEMRMLMEVRGIRAMGDYAIKNFLHIGAFKNILSTAEQIEQLLVEQGVITQTAKIDRLHFQFGDPRLNENADKVGLIKALIMAGFYPNLGVRLGRAMYRTPREANVFVHPTSINGIKMSEYKSKLGGNSSPPDRKTELLAYSELVKAGDGNTTYLRDTTPVTPLMAALFAGKLEQRSARNVLQMDDWLPCYLPQSQTMRPLIRLNESLQAVTTSAFNDLAARRVLTDHEPRNQFADAVVQVLDYDLAFNAARSSRSNTAFRSTKNGASALSRGNNRRSDSGNTDQGSKRQEMWDDLINSWSAPSKDASDGPRHSSSAALFAEGHADLRSSRNSAARSR